MNASRPLNAARLQPNERELRGNCRGLAQHESFVVLSHVRPDGDALGSQIAMGLSLQKLGKKVKVWNEEGLLEKFSFLPGGELVTMPPNEPRGFRCRARARHRDPAAAR